MKIYWLEKAAGDHRNHRFAGIARKAASEHRGSTIMTDSREISTRVVDRLGFDGAGRLYAGRD